MGKENNENGRQSPPVLLPRFAWKSCAVIILRMNAVTLTEKVVSNLVGGLKIDRDHNRIYGVKVLGYQSLNGRRYLPAAVKAAAPLYEGAMVNIDHPEGKPTDQRSAYDRFGKLVNVRYIENKGLYADLEYLASHPMASRVLEAAEKMPDLFGLSHNAEGEGEDDDNGVFIIHKITEVRHVDLVADPATTRSLSEGITMRSRKMNEIDILEQDSVSLNNAGEKHEDAAQDKAMLRDLLSKILHGEGSSDYKLDKLEAAFKEGYEQKKAMEAAMAAPKAEPEEMPSDEKMEGYGSGEMTKDEKMAGEPQPDDEEKKASMSESILAQKIESLQAQIDKARRINEIRELCESVGLNATKELVEDLTRIPADIVERHAKALALAHKASKPRTGIHQVTESVNDKIPTGLSLGNFLTN